MLHSPILQAPGKAEAMNYTNIIKRSWQITWRYKAMWVLGIFAGISGCQPGGGGGGGGTGSTGRDMRSFMGDGGNMPRIPSVDNLGRELGSVMQWLPALLAAAIVVLLLIVVWSILSVAARGGLVTGVDAAENGVKMRVGEMWGAGFGRFWALVGVDVVLVLPLVFLGLLLAVFIIVPIMGATTGGGDALIAAAVPVCGALGLGIPLLLVASFVLGIMHPIAVRYVMLGGQGVGHAVANSWRFLRARVKDTVLMWLISGALNFAAGFVLAIPVIVIAVVLGIAMGGVFYTEQWSLLVALGGTMLFLIMLLSIAYGAIWGTFTSALWTLFFREVTGMGTPVREARPELEVRESTIVPEQPLPPTPPVPATEPPNPTAPPMAPYGDGPGA